MNSINAASLPLINENVKTDENASQRENNDGNSQIEPAKEDSVVLNAEKPAISITPEKIISSKINKFEAAERATNDVIVHLFCSDTPAVMSMWANLGTLPLSLLPALDFFNMINTATGVLSIAMDGRETFKTVTNPKATKMDKVMDVTHLIAGDVVSTVGSMVPLVASLNSPIALGVFVGGQLLGLGMDIVKTVYDGKRKGQQSAH